MSGEDILISSSQEVRATVYGLAGVPRMYAAKRKEKNNTQTQPKVSDKTIDFNFMSSQDEPMIKKNSA